MPQEALTHDTRSPGPRSADDRATLPDVLRAEIHSPPLSPAHHGAPNHSPPQKLSPWERWLFGKVLDACGNPPVRIRYWTGEEFSTSSQAAVGTIQINDRDALRQLFRDPQVAFGDCFSTGQIEIEGDLVAVLCAVTRSINSARPASLFGRLLARKRPPRRSHSITASRDSVHHHYDIGNDFYRLWLDKQLLYTCAYYPTPEATLEEAQIAKMDHVCRKLCLRPGQRVAEAGCGWGALALHMARHYGVSVKAYNLSREQIAYARQSAKSEGLDHQVEFIEDDYRTVTGQFDAFVSVGMLEHVGRENFLELGRVIDRVLAPHGNGLIHSIGRNAPRPLDPWTDKRIFPGAYPPALSEMMTVFEPHGFSVLDIENLRLHYARTLEHWLERFEQNADKVRAMFDERFVRTWRMYLAASIAAFRVGSLQLFQVTFARDTNNEIPWTRQHLYAERASERRT